MTYAIWNDVPVFLGEDPAPPPPKRGGTFVYCPWAHVEKRTGRTEVTLCASEAQGVVLDYTRFRTEKAYRRHWRRQHASSVG
jgi:hypothetical protein